MNEKEYLKIMESFYNQYVKNGEGEVAWHEFAENICGLTIDYYERIK